MRDDPAKLAEPSVRQRLVEAPASAADTAVVKKRYTLFRGAPSRAAGTVCATVRRTSLCGSLRSDDIGRCEMQTNIAKVTVGLSQVEEVPKEAVRF